jgi:ABC-type transporter Mla maintaining outer membrane lipid asymmetry ATPase subunit MlaF
MAAIIELKNVSFSAQGRVLIRNVSYQYAEGKTTALVGPSGGGKSTMLKLSAGLLVPDRGEICFQGKNIFQMNRKENLEFRREGAVVFQDSALWANQSLFQILELPLRIHYPELSPKEREKRIEAVVAEVGYRKELSIRPAHLSMGEQKLIAFARALLCRPRLLYLDEWVESLDDNGAQRLISLVKYRQEAGDTIIFVSHDLQIIKDLADEIVLILSGQVFLRLTREQITADEDLMRYVAKGIAS